MGKEWDRFRGAVTDRDFKGFVLSQQRTRNVKCPDCGNWAYDHPGRLCECGGIRRAQGTTYQAWCQAWATGCLRVLKPGGHMLASGGTRTWHRLACAVEDAGFEVRDSLHWLYGSGFPKSLDVSKAIDKAAGAEREVVGTGQYAGRGRRTDNEVYGKATPSEQEVVTAPATAAAAAWDGWGTALKPSHEPIVLARKPLAGTVAANVLAHGTGALNIDGCRVGPGGQRRWAAPRGMGYSGGTDNGPAEALESNAGRWPPNVLLSPETAGELDRQSGTLTSGANPAQRGADKFRDAYGEFTGQRDCVVHRGADTGGASRFFPCFRYQAKAPSKERPRLPDGTAHPTVKPVGLMRWLARLVTPSGGLILDPFAGTGTTLEAALLEGFRAIGIERERDYCDLAVQRMSRHDAALPFGQETGLPVAG